MSEQQNKYRKGELVPETGTWRCTGSGEVWVADQKNIRFPPCEACKDGGCEWELVQAGR